MASLTDVFTEKERTNWLKAWLAVDITKSGLEHFVDKQAQIVHADIYNVVTSRFGTANINQVRDEIKKRHRYGNGSWQNSSEKQWSSHAWEIAKCYFPPDGYSGNMSAHDTDFNGIINFMLNCLHFDSKFSFPITTGKPTTQAQCPLYKAREVVKAVRHSSQMKVTDADLKCYFTTLNDLMSDSRSLGADSGAQNAVVKLAQLEKDVLRLTTEEMIQFLKAVDTTLKQNLTDVADTSMTELRECRDLCLKKIEDYLETCKQDLSKQADMHKHDIDAHVNIHRHGIDDHTDKCKQDIDKHADKRSRVYNEQHWNFPFSETAYKQGCTEMLRLLTTYYKKAHNFIITSPLNDCIREKLGDIYMPPKVQLMTGNKWSFQKTGVHITEYKNMILTDGKLNEKIFIQGEAGTGKSTFIAKLAIDWCCITTQVPEQLQRDTKTIADTATPTKGSTFFQDLKTLQLFKFVILIKLRNSVKQLEISKMIKEQLIDLMYSSEEDREKANKLLNEIMKRERCLILLDGLDEWTDPGGGYLPTLAESHNQCIMLITTRPWKLALGKVCHSAINALVNLDGVNEPMKLSKNIMSCIIDRNELENKYAEFKRYVRAHNLNNLLLSPMMLSVIVCAFAEGMATKGSKCKLFCVLLECLLKKANSKSSNLQDPRFPWFAETQYIQPNIEHVNRLAEAAFHLLFSNKRENSLVFGIEELQTYLGEEHIDVALKSGILSTIHQASPLRSLSSFWFIHKSVQEFLAAHHIACNPQVLDGVISGYLKRSDSSYLDITEVLIFLCGLDILSANKLSYMMDKCDQLHYNDNKFNSSPFQHCVLSGYGEAVDNAQTCINLKLSHFIINDNDNHRDLHSLWVMNAPNVKLLRVTVFSRDPLPDFTSSSKCDNSASSMDFELSSCQELTVLKLYGYGICLKDVVSSAASVCPVRFLLNNADPADHSSEILPSIEHIELGDVTCSTTWLQSLFNILKTLKHNVKCVLEDCEITSQMKKFDRMMRTQILSLSSFMFRSFCSLELSMVYINIPDLWKFLDGLDIKSLSLNSDLVCSTNKHAASLGHSLSLTKFKERHIHSKYDDAFGTIQLEHLIGLNITSLRLSSELNRYAKEHVSLFSQFLSSLTRLEVLSMDMFDLNPSQWKALHGLNIKNLSLCGMLNSLAKSHVFWFSQSLSSLTQLETLSMEMYDNNSGLLIGLHDLNIKNLSLTWQCSTMEHLISQSLSSLKQLETLSMEFIWYSPCVLAALHGLHIKCLSMSGQLHISAEEHEVLFSRVLSSLTQLETLNLEIGNASSGIWRALRGLNIKNLSLCGTFNSSAREHLSLISQSLRGCLDSSAKELVVSVAHSLASLTQLETLSIEFSENSLGMLETLYCLNIKSLILNCRLGFSTRDHESSLKLALSSLTHLETLSLNLMNFDAGLLEPLHGLHIKNLNISGWLDKNHVSWGIKHVSLLVHSLSQLETLSISLSSDLSPSLSLRGLFGCLSKEHKCVYQQFLPIHLNTFKTYSLRYPDLRSLSFI